MSPYPACARHGQHPPRDELGVKDSSKTPSLASCCRLTWEDTSGPWADFSFSKVSFAVGWDDKKAIRLPGCYAAPTAPSQPLQKWDPPCHPNKCHTALMWPRPALSCTQHFMGVPQQTCHQPCLCQHATAPPMAPLATPPAPAPRMAPAGSPLPYCDLSPPWQRHGEGSVPTVCRCPSCGRRGLMGLRGPQGTMWLRKNSRHATDRFWQVGFASKCLQGSRSRHHPSFPVPPAAAPQRDPATGLPIALG